jgi:stalled ribosome rescue protein Dom34
MPPQTTLYATVLGSIDQTKNTVTTKGNTTTVPFADRMGNEHTLAISPAGNSKVSFQVDDKAPGVMNNIAQAKTSLKMMNIALIKATEDAGPRIVAGPKEIDIN